MYLRARGDVLLQDELDVRAERRFRFNGHKREVLPDALPLELHKLVENRLEEPQLQHTSAYVSIRRKLIEDGLAQEHPTLPAELVPV